MASLLERVRAAVAAFREPQLITSLGGSSEFEAFESRTTRYDIYWAFFENSAYRSVVHSWARAYKVAFGLYRYIRGIYNPAHRLGEFWQTHLMGGDLDPEAGDGSGTPSALPILTENEALRPALAQLWRVSNWQSNKDIYTLRGTVLGDTAMEVVDDRERQAVYLRVLNPAVLESVELDPFGNVKAYVIQETRTHPERNVAATYREEATRDGVNVVYRTYLNGQPYAWPGQESAVWAEAYGFVPMVVVQHNNVGLEWGWSEMHPGRGKFQEVDDLASKLSDQVRKLVDAPWLFAGVGKPSSTPTAASRDSETYQQSSSAVSRPEPGREEVPIFYAPASATATALVAPLDIAATASYIKDLLQELERDFPELQMDIWTAGGDASGRALRVARQRAESKVRARRVAYDAALVRAQQMAIAIGGFRGYQGYEGFGLESYDRGQLDHSIAKRTVFAQDPMDDAELDKALWQNANEAVKAGVPLEFYLLEHGWSEDKVARLVQALEARARRFGEMEARFRLNEEEDQDQDDGEE